MKKQFWILIIIAGLAACADEEGDVQRGPEWLESRQGLIYAYPMDGQLQVPRSAPVLLRFSSDIVDSFPEDAITLEETGGPEREFSVREAGGGRSLVLMPDTPLAPLTEYSVTVEGLGLADGEAATQALTFSTRGLVEGPLSQMAAPGDFAILRRIPDGQGFPYLDFSSLRVQFTRPLERQTVRYGDTVSLEGPDGLVDAEVLVSGPHLTVDPEEDLTPGAEYNLTLGSGIEDSRGNAFPGDSQAFTPANSGSRSVMVQQVMDSGGGVELSPLTGEPVNRVPLEAVLLGDDNFSQQSGDLRVELAHIPSFPDTAPLRIPKGTRLEGTAMDVLIGGVVPAGFDSGTVSIRFMSDAMGYMLPNPWSSLPEAPRQIVLYMDVAIHTGEPRASGAVTQDLLHLELVGAAIVKDGQLTVDAASVAEPRVLGQESARSLLSFHMRSYQDQQNAPLPNEDNLSPALDSWIPGDTPNLQRPNDPIILQFSEPLDGGSLQAGDTLTLTNGMGAAVPFSHYRDGAAVVIEPEQPLDYGAEYLVGLQSGITDTVGNALPPQTLNFRMPVSVLSNIHAPLVLSANPGFPCVAMDHDLANNDAGRCQGGAADDDHMPLARQPADRSIRVSFSRTPDPATVNDNTFTVEQVDAAGNPTGDVAGELRFTGHDLTFMPDEPWEPGSLYRYTLHSVTTGPICGTNAICDPFGLPLQTRMLAQQPADAPGRLQGGPDMPVYFRAVDVTEDVRQPLRNLPTADVNANFVADAGEPLPSTDPDAERNSTRIARDPAANPDNDGTSASGNAVADLNVGCGFDGDLNPLDCPDDQFGFMNGNLEVEVVGFIPPGDIDQTDPDIPDVVKNDGGVLVYINPTRVMMSAVTVYPRVSDAAQLLNFEAEPADTGPQLLRIRYTCDASVQDDTSADYCEGPDHGRVRGWIVDEGGTSRFMANLDLYLDAPRLDPVVKNHNFDPPQDVAVSHNLRSLPLNLELAGELSFLDDGRLRIEQQNADPISIQVILDIENGLLDSVLYLRIPAGDARLEFVTPPSKP